MLLDDQEMRERVGRIETLLEEIESFEDPEARAKTAQMVQTLLELYGEGLGRIVESVGRLGGEDLKDELLGDELITHLLLLHGLHPVGVKTRVLGALDEVRPYLESHGGNVQFLGIGDGVARVRLERSRRRRTGRLPGQRLVSWTCRAAGCWRRRSLGSRCYS